ncbi:MAG: diguanylate cyclase, partial [Desulfobacterales bacterium]
AGDEARTVAQRIRSALEREKFTPESGKDVTITISIGVTEYYPKEELSSFIQRADKAMYNSKKNGRNRVSLMYAEPPNEAQAKS